MSTFIIFAETHNRGIGKNPNLQPSKNNAQQIDADFQGNAGLTCLLPHVMIGFEPLCK